MAFARRIHRMIALGLALDEPEAAEDAKEQEQAPPEEQDEGSRMEEARTPAGCGLGLTREWQDQGSRMEEAHTPRREYGQGLGEYGRTRAAAWSRASCDQETPRAIVDLVLPVEQDLLEGAFAGRTVT